jgi:membrane protein implicated in regulation of membrane protease activity
VSDEAGLDARLWRPLNVRGIPLHVVLPVGTALLALLLLTQGGLAAVLGGWILTVGFSVAVGAFVRDPRALAAPAALWAFWLVIVAIAGADSELPRTPVWLAIVLAALGAICVALGQRAVQPAVEQPRGPSRTRGVDTDFDELLTPTADPADSPSLDPAAEVDDALAELLDEDALDAEPAEAADPAGESAQAPASDASTDNTHPQAEASTSGGAAQDDRDEHGDEDEDDESGQVIEFAALSEDDLEAPEPAHEPAPLPAATEAGRRDPG